MALFQLPPITSLRNWDPTSEEEDDDYSTFIDMAALSANPSLTSDYVLMICYIAKYNYRFGFWQPGDLNWTTIPFVMYGEITDIHYFNGQFYFIARFGDIYVVDPLNPGPRLLIMELEDDILKQSGTIFNLVEISGALLFVIQICDYEKPDGPNCGYHTIKFLVWELDVIKGSEVKKNKELGDRTIFLGRNSSILINDSSKFAGVKPNQIYFTDNWTELFTRLEGGGGKDMGSYSLEHETIQSFYNGISVSPIRPPTWVIPSLSYKP